MATSTYEEWLARGRDHEAAGRPLDAIACYRRARKDAAEDPGQGQEAAWRSGEVLWHLGRYAEAVREWQRVESTATLPELLTALAEAALTGGDLDAAAHFVQRALDVSPTLPRAHTLRVLVDHAAGDKRSDADAQLASALQVDDLVITRGPLMTAIAARIEQAPHAFASTLRVLHGSIAVLTSLDRVPARLLATLAEAGARREIPVLAWELVAARSYAADEHDAARRLLRVARDLPAPSADVLQQAYVAACRASARSTAPMCWPRRMHGPMRVALMIGGSSEQAGCDALLDTLRAEGGMSLTVVTTASHLAVPFAQADLQLGPEPGVHEARRLAALDADVLVDAVGLSGSVGVLLAARPVRYVVALETDSAPAQPLVDARSTSTTELLVRLREHALDLDGAPGVACGPADMAGRLDAAVDAHRQGNLLVAREAYDRVLDAQPGYAIAHYLRGVLHRDRGDFDAAAQDLGAALAIAPDYLEARLAAAQLALDTKQPEAVTRLTQDRLMRTPEHAPFWRMAALARLAADDAAAAVGVFEAALDLDPTHADTHFNHGVALQARGDRQSAARAYQRALTIDPAHHAAEFNLAALFQQQGAHAGAIAAYRHFLAAHPTHVAAYAQLGEALFAVGDIDGWRANFDAFERACPGSLRLAAQALEVCQYHGDWRRLDDYLEGLSTQRFNAATSEELIDALEQLLYLLLFFDVEPSVLRSFASTYAAAARSVYGEHFPRAPRRAGRPRIGYVSADLRNHVMGKMMWPVIAGHDRSRFDVYLYSLSASEDAWTARYRELGRFTSVAGIGAQAAARRIAADDIDLLIDLSTHTRGSEPGIFARKPARAQLTHVASAGTLGLDTIDFKLTDRHADVPESAEHQLEPLLAMEGCVYPYRHVEPANPHPYHRASLGLGPELILIGAFVTAMKLSRRCLALWRQVLEQVPRARLVCSPVTATLRRSYVRIFAAAGIAPDRILFLPQAPGEALNQARYSLIDLVLDPMPFGGVNGTLEALDMRVPVVTLVGRRHGERSSFSILQNLGVISTIAHSGPEYVDIAVRLCSDAAFREAVRAEIGAGLAASALTDTAAHLRHVEDAYLQALAACAPEALDALPA